MQWRDCLGPAICVVVALAACQSYGPSVRGDGPERDFDVVPATAGPDGAVRFARLGPYQRDVTTDSEGAKFWFDQGLLWTWGFNHDEAVRSFREAQRHDPEFAMAYWGEAFALGPNINAPMADETAARRAYAASREAQRLAGSCAPVEKALIEALTRRYADVGAGGSAPNAPFGKPTDRAAHDAAYADAMAEVYREFPDDPEVGALFADARMNQRPWDYWRDGKAEPGMQEALDALRHVIAKHPRHPGAHHLMIHVTESSPDPHEGVPSAEVLASLVPGSGHLVHMPAHTFHRVGRYLEAEETNHRAIAVDRAYFAEVGPQGIYELYLAHNHHFRAWSAMYGGRFASAIDAARDLVKDLPPSWKTGHPAFVDGYMPVEAHVLVRFGKWDEVLEVPEYDEIYPIARALRRYSRGVALAALGRTDDARAELEAFEREVAKVADDAVVGFSPAAPVLRIARHMLTGELAYRGGEHDRAFEELWAAANEEDDLRYDEPLSWMTPVRHAIGALALEQGRIEEAERAYREDLERNPENGWSLHGLAECLRRRGANDEAAEVEARFEKAWAHADTPLEHGSCFCRGAIDTDPSGG